MRMDGRILTPGWSVLVAGFLFAVRTKGTSGHWSTLSFPG
jgi:hypothetical protein